MEEAEGATHVQPWAGSWDVGNQSDGATEWLA